MEKIRDDGKCLLGCWVFGLFPALGFDKQSCYEDPGTRHSSDMSLFLLGEELQLHFCKCMLIV